MIERIRRLNELRRMNIMSNKDRYLPIHDYKVMDLDKDELLNGIDIVKRLNKQDKEFKCLEKRFELINNMNWMIKTFIAKYETTNEFKDADEVIDLIKKELGLKIVNDKD